MSILYVSSDVATIPVAFDLDIRPVQGSVFQDNIQIDVTPGKHITAINSAIAEKSTINLPEADYQYTYNPSTNTVDVMLDGEMVVPLPVDNEGKASSITVDGSDVANIQVMVNDQGEFVIDPDSLPQTESANVIQVTDAVDNVLTATDGHDVFVLDVQSDENGAFTQFGEITIDGYQEGQDIIAFIDQLNVWDSVAEFKNGTIGANEGNAMINFNNNPEYTTADQALIINGAVKDVEKPFSNEIADLNVNFAVDKAETVDTLGIQAYADDLIDAMIA